MRKFYEYISVIIATPMNNYSNNPSLEKSTKYACIFITNNVVPLVHGDIYLIAGKALKRGKIDAIPEKVHFQPITGKCVD